MLSTGNCLYVDKTQCIINLFKKERHAFISRQRRFGKSLMPRQ
ncbi:MAG: AAA family ATPase [Desulfovibrio sp.]|nr:AAA family ATPase [Desulfovibrio sp.]